MTKSELILAVSKRFPQLTHSDTALSIQTILNSMADQLGRSERIELRGFGSFGIRLRAARISRNPRTGEKVHVVSKHVTYFKPGIELRGIANDMTPAPKTQEASVPM